MLGFRGVSCLVFVITSGFRLLRACFLFGYIVHSDRAPNALGRAAKALVTSGITHDATL